MKNYKTVQQTEALLEERQLKRANLNLLATRRQAKQGEYMIQQYVDHAENVQLGSYVCVRVDKRDRRVNCGQGILGVVIAVTINKRIKVWSEEGILSFNGQPAICSPDTYAVLSEFATVPSKLRAMRDQVMAGYRPTGPMVSKPEVHLLQNGSWFHMRCACKKQCGASCKCVKNKLGCGSGCGCRLNGFSCSNTSNEDDNE
jgi:hypothetical protein